MKNAILIFLNSCLAIVLCTSCEMGNCLHGTGKKTKQVYETGYFREVNARGMFEIILVQDSFYYIELEGGDKVLEYTGVKNIDSILYLDNSNDCFFLRDYEKIKCYVHFTDYFVISLFDVCKVTSQHPITSNLTMIVPAEMAEVDIQLDNPHFHFYNHRNTGGSYTFRGFCDWCVISGYYAAKFDLSSLMTREMNINNSTIGDIYVRADELLRVQIHNKGNVYFYGSPEIIIDSISGTGQLFPVED